MNDHKLSVFFIFCFFYANFLLADELNKNEIKTVTYCIDPHFMPYEQINSQGIHEGLSADYIKLFEKKTNLNFQLIPTKDYQESRNLFKEGKCSLVLADVAPEEKVDYLYTNSYFNTQSAVITREDNTENATNFYIDTTAFNVGTEPIVVYNGVTYTSDKMNLVPVESDLNGIEKVLTNQAKRYISTLPTLSFTIQNNGIVGIKLFPLGDKLEFCMHVHKDFPWLVDLLNETIKQVTAEEQTIIRNKWITVNLDPVIDYQLMGEIFLVVFLLFLILSYYNYKIKQQKNFVKTLIDTQEQIVITLEQNQFKSVNKSCLLFFDISSFEEFKEVYKNKSIFEIFNFIGIRKNNSNIKYCLENKINRATILRNNKKHIFSLTISALSTQDDLYLIVFNDITEIENAKKQIEEIHEHTQQSIQYASITQHAILPESDLIDNFFNQYFMIWKPKDIVGGDIFLFEPFNNDNECLLMVIDCVGHGVAGALVTMLVKALEREIITEIISTNQKEISTSKILINFNKSMKQLLKQENKDSISNAGFDGAVVYYNKQKGILKYSGAQIPLYIIEDGELTVLKADRQSIGYKKSDKDYIFKEHILTVSSGVQLFITTDGYIDQNGGEKDFPFGKKRFTNILLENHHQFSNLKEILLEELETWKNNHHYNDDITLIGLKL